MLTRPSLLTWLRTGRVRNLLTLPVIYSVLVPMLLLDAWVTAFQWTCFPIFGIDRVRRRPYFVLDRHRLAYLNAIEKLHCTYCSYATGVLAYTREVTSRTEAYWCPIRHHRATAATHRLSPRFFAYGDATAYHRGLMPLRRTLRPDPRHRRRTAA